MIQLSRMELADCGNPEKLIVEILRQLPTLSPPVPVEDIAVAVGIEEIRDLDTEGFEGALIALADKSRGVILVRKNSPPYRRRFSISHELGHFLIPTHVAIDSRGFMCRADDMRMTQSATSDRAARMEVEANRFAAHLLMPPPLLRRELARLRGADISHILQLADRYDVSKEAAARRYVEYQSELCAVVVSKDGVILRIYRQRLFPFVPLSSGDPVPPNSLTARHKGDSLSNWSDVDVSIWIEEGRRQYQRALNEQVLLQRDGFRLTLLNLECEDEEDADLEERIAASWEPKFRR